MTDHATNAGVPGDDLLAQLRTGRLSRGEFQLGERGPLQTRWFIRVSFSPSEYEELRANAAQSILTCDVMKVTERHSALVIGVNAVGTLHQFFVLLAGNTVEHMLSDLVAVSLYLMLETPDGRVIDVRVPIPDELLFSLTESQRKTVDDEEACLLLLRASSLLAINPAPPRGTTARLTVTAVLPPEVAAMASDESET